MTFKIIISPTIHDPPLLHAIWNTRWIVWVVAEIFYRKCFPLCATATLRTEDNHLPLPISGWSWHYLLYNIGHYVYSSKKASWFKERTSCTPFHFQLFYLCFLHIYSMKKRQFVQSSFFSFGIKSANVLIKIENFPFIQIHSHGIIIVHS